MAGNYPNAPSWRMPYDRDGTQVYRIDGSNNIYQLTSQQITQLNDETPHELFATGSPDRLVFFFPELRDIDAFFARSFRTSPGSVYGTWLVQVSANTTNGLDGTWTTLLGSYAAPNSVPKPAYRSPASGTALGVRALRIVPFSDGAYFSPSNIHIYGEVAPADEQTTLAIWHPTLDEKIGPAAFDWGDTPRGSSADRTFRVKNLSDIYTADNIRCAMEALTDASPSVPAQHSLSYNGGTFLAQVLIGDLAPGAISEVLTLRRITPSNAALSLWTMRVFAAPDAWIE